MGQSFQSAAARKRVETGSDSNATIEFDVDGETFHATAIPPGGALLDASAVSDAPTNAERARLIGTFLDAVLLPESAERFVGRMRNPENPIDLPVAADVVRFLVGEYGGRPTEPSSPS